MQDMIGDKKLSEGKQGNTPPKLDLTPEQVAAMRRAASLAAPDIEALPSCHPATVLRAENEAMNAQIATLLHDVALPETPADFVPRFLALNAVRTHFMKKEELIMPMLYQYGVTGPSDVMWRDDDAMKKELGTISRSLQEDAENVVLYRGRIQALLQQLTAMTRKEDAILFPLALRYFTEEEWYAIYDDAIDMGTAFLATQPAPWEAAEAWRKAQADAADKRTFENGKIQLPTGELTVRELRAILKLAGIDITFIDAADHLRFFENEGKVFARPKLALGRPVYDCHPTQIVPVVKHLLADFKAKRRDHMTVWRRIAKRPIGVRYHAVYDDDGTDLGAVEFVQDFTEALAHFGK